MTVREFIIDFLYNRFMLFDDVINGTIEYIENQEHCEALVEVLDRGIEGYPDVFKTVVMMTVEASLKEYLEKEHPQLNFILPLLRGELGENKKIKKVDK